MNRNDIRGTLNFTLQSKNKFMKAALQKWSVPWRSRDTQHWHCASMCERKVERSNLDCYDNQFTTVQHEQKVINKQTEMVQSLFQFHKFSLTSSILNKYW